MSKYFVINPAIEKVSKSAILESLEAEQALMSSGDATRRNATKEQMKVEETLKWVDGRVIVKVDLKGKNSYRFENGTEIRLEREYNNFNRRQTQPVNALVISAEYIPTGSEVLIYHNSTHDNNKIFDYEPLGSLENETDVKYFSIPEYECFAWKDESGKWNPLKNFEFALRVFRPYEGFITGIEPEVVKDVLYVTTGALKGNVVNVLKASDYEIVFQNENGREGNLIRFRHSEDEDFDREEVICINHDLTEKVNDGKLLIGIEIKDAKRIIEYGN